MAYLLGVGMKVAFDDGVYEVVGLKGQHVLLRGRDGSLSSRATAECAIHGNPLDVDLDAPSAGVDVGVQLLPADQRETFLERLRDLNEIIHGHPEGRVDQGPKPRAAYDLEKTTKTSRVAAKAEERGQSVATWWNYLRAFEEGGPMGLLPAALGRPAGRHRMHPEFVAAVQGLLARERNKSTHTAAYYYREAARLVDADKLPNSRTFYRWFDLLDERKGATRRAKTRRNLARQDGQMFRRVIADYPGQLVLIDTTGLNVLLLDPTTGHIASHELAVALDLYSRSVLAWRFVKNGPDRVDAVMLLRDCLVPVAWREEWPERSKWPYIGVPETVVMPDSEIPLAGKPVIHPDSVVIDNAKLYLSDVHLAACQHQGINVVRSRILHPEDKAQVERNFDTIDTMFLQHLDGYRGSEVYDRGEDVEGDAILTLEEVDAAMTDFVVNIYQARPHSGLVHPGNPQLACCPNDLLDEGFARTGFRRLPNAADLYYQLLPIEWRTVQNDGVELLNLTYDGDCLTPYRSRPEMCPYPGGKWPIRYDTRDRSRVFIFMPGSGHRLEGGEWHELEWIHYEHVQVPFSDLAVRHARRLVTERGGGWRDERWLTAELAAFLDRVLGPATEPASGRERRIAANMQLQTRQASLDQVTRPRFRGDTRERTGAPPPPPPPQGDTPPPAPSPLPRAEEAAPLGLDDIWGTDDD